ncbi:SRPBCC family protein [Streptomyces sp. I05A-00742]|uniref:SRPBCC family protein n=1 Tax=Streptomyces sp. I05A-00742 TaxID=2732853 RepID=UPI001487C66C|nr:SRPBCC family protein [Streptomyces sp. I05A-00742]
MARRLRPVGADFAGATGSAGSAPLRLTFVSRTAAEPARVYRALAEDVTAWPRWYRVVTLARPLDGTGRRRREIRLMGGARFEETVMAADAPERYAYRVDATNVPGLRAVLEDWRLAPAGSGTLVRWTLALDAPLPLRCLVLLGRPVMRRTFRDAVRALDRHLAADGATGAAGAPGDGGPDDGAPGRAAARG